MWNDRVILGLMIMSFIPFAFGYSASFLLPAFNQSILGGGPDDLGLLMTAMGAGALAGSMALARAGDFNGKGRVLFGASYFWALTVGAFAATLTMFPALFLCALIGFFSAIVGSLNGSVLQLAVSPEIRGRIMSIYMMTWGLVPLGVMPVSVIAEYIGIDWSLLAAAAMLAVSMFCLGLFLPELKRIDKGWGAKP